MINLTVFLFAGAEAVETHYYNAKVFFDNLQRKSRALQGLQFVKNNNTVLKIYVDAVSVRDANSGSIVKHLTGAEPVYHLDPVLMYDYVGKCTQIPQSVPEKDYIIVYGYSGRLTDAECKQIRQYADAKKMKVLCIGGVQNCCDAFIDCSPFEVIAYFQNAQAVVTDTFHGTILSIITHRRFASIVRSSGYGNAEKLTDLLQRLRLTDRILPELSQLETLLAAPINYTEADELIRTERQRTYQYLQQFIE